MTEATVERLRLFLIDSPIKMARLLGVGSVKGSVKRVHGRPQRQCAPSSACGRGEPSLRLDRFKP